MTVELSPEAQALADETDAAIREHAEAIGLICIYTAILDSTLLAFLERLVQVSPKEAACLFSASEDLSRRCTILINLVYANGPKKGKWTQCVVDLLNFIKNEIAPRRNRYVHDDWRVKEGKVIRADKRVKMHKEPFKPTEIITVSEGVADTEDMHKVVHAINQAMVHIIFLGMAYTNWREGGPLPESNEQAIVLSKSKLPVPTPLGRGSPQLPPLSSRA